MKQEMVKASVEVFKEAYEDAFKPPAQEIGKALGTIGKTVNMALSPIRAVVWGWEQIEEYINVKVSEKLDSREVTEGDIITPDPDVAVPTIEAMRYSKLKNEYANLLATSMTKSEQFTLHPSFVEILKQLTPDEVKILNTLPIDKSRHPFISLKRVLKNLKGEVGMSDHFGSLNKTAKIEHTHKTEAYINNLVRLGIISIPHMMSLTKEGRYEDALSDEYVKKMLAIENDAFKWEYDKRFFELTAMGRDFLRAVLDRK